MNAWIHDTATAPNNDHATFNPNAPMLQNPPSQSFGQGHFPGQQSQQSMLNGAPQGSSFPNPLYQVNPVVPSKRPREDSIHQSPRQLSRSQTPRQAPYPGYQPTTNGAQPLQPHSPYPHLPQEASSNATPSPTMQNQMFSGPGAQQRMQTASPFSPAGPSFGQSSPAPSDHGSRVNTPQNNAAAFAAKGMPYGPGMNQHSATPSSMAGSPGLPPSLQQQQQQQQQQQLYRMRMQQQFQHMQGNHNVQMGPGARQMPQNMMARPQNGAEQFMKNLQLFMNSKGMPLDTTPVVSGRPVNLLLLYSIVMKAGGYKRVSSVNFWPQVAEQLHFPPMHLPNAPLELAAHYQRNLYPYESFFRQMQQQNRQRPQPGHPNNFMISQQQSPVRPPVSQVQMQPTQNHLQQQPRAQPEQVLNSTPTPTSTSSMQQNGLSLTQQRQSPFPESKAYRSHSSSTSRPPGEVSTPPQPPRQNSFHLGSASPAAKDSTPLRSASMDSVGKDIGGNFTNGRSLSPTFHPLPRELDGSFGGIEIDEIAHICTELEELRPKVPTVHELGVIDLRALTLSIQSGIHAEVRLALDVLARLSIDHHFQLDLQKSEDLLEVLIECAEDQLNLLAEHAAEVSDEMLISPYEDVVRGCYIEAETLQDIPEFASLSYELDRAADRLICITTILRNLSFYEVNHFLLASAPVVKLIAAIVKFLGTRNMLLRTNRNTLDIMKDLIVFLSNVSQAIDLPGKEEGLCILHFLLSFAPSPPPTAFGPDQLIFTPFAPNIHQYLPPAVDALAKLLAKDEPNRTYYKIIFSSDGGLDPPYEVLTRAFALAVAAVPGYSRVLELAEPRIQGFLEQQKAVTGFDSASVYKKSLLNLAERRRATLAQGMLAAELLVNLLPGSDLGLARSWLISGNNLFQDIMRLIEVLLEFMALRNPPHHGADPDSEAYRMIIRHAIALLRNLSEKCINQDAGNSESLPGIFPKKEILLDLLIKPHVDAGLLRQYCSFANWGRQI
ncbi:MAG: hypothetical protein M1834_004427 [Cirrosporium novae-zelandiae]|nr:MAG: hypothetical protein M1834_004427 [Cirrosporium novae-zelandiae]